MNRFFMILLCGSVLAGGCKQQPVDGGGGQTPPTSSGAYVLNEGDFGDPGGARLSFYDIKTDSAYLDVFEAANGGMHLGSLGDDLVIADGLLYALMSGSENLTVIDPTDNTQIRSESYAGSVPHDILINPLMERIYLTRLFSGSILVVDLKTLASVQTIPVGLNPQGMELVDDYLFVCNSGYGSDSTVSVIDVRTHIVVGTITVGDGPTGIIVGPDGFLWVACSGNQFGSPATNGAVYRINPANLAVVDSLQVPGNLWGSIHAGTDSNMYVIGVDPTSFSGGAVHRINASSLTVELDFVPGIFYAMGIEPVTGDLYLTDANDFAADGEVHIYDRNGQYRSTFPAQRGPGSIAFHQ